MKLYKISGRQPSNNQLINKIVVQTLFMVSGRPHNYSSIVDSLRTLRESQENEIGKQIMNRLEESLNDEHTIWFKFTDDKKQELRLNFRRELLKAMKLVSAVPKTASSKSIKVAAGPLTAYHGTCYEIYREILEVRYLSHPYIARDFYTAQHYAKSVNRELRGGGEVVLELNINDTSFLRYDENSMLDPVFHAENIQPALEAARQDNPDWFENGVLKVPREAWEISWNAVGTAEYRGRISTRNIRNVTIDGRVSQKIPKGAI